MTSYGELEILLEVEDILPIEEEKLHNYSEYYQKKLKSIDKNIQETKIAYKNKLVTIKKEFEENKIKNKDKYKLYKEAQESLKGGITLKINEQIGLDHCRKFKEAVDLKLVKVKDNYREIIQKYLNNREKLVLEAETDHKKQLDRKLKNKAEFDSDSNSEPSFELAKTVEEQNSELEEVVVNLTTKQITQEQLNKIKFELKTLENTEKALNQIEKGLISNYKSWESGTFEAEFNSYRIEQVSQYLKIIRHRIDTREKIVSGKRRQFELEEESELSDQGYSDTDIGIESTFFKQKVKRNKLRKKVPKFEDFENLEIESESEEEIEDNNMANTLKWSLQNISKFYGKDGEDPDQHVEEFEDVAKAAGQWGDGHDWSEGKDTNGKSKNLIILFSTTLKDKARSWFDSTFQEEDKRNFEDYEAIKRKFQDRFNIYGNTEDKRVSTFQNMRWDPSTDINEFAYKLEKLGKSLGLNDRAILWHFRSTLPSTVIHMVYKEKSLQDMTDAISLLMGTGFKISNNASKDIMDITPTQPKFMAMMDNNFDKSISKLEDKFGNLFENSMQYVGSGLNHISEMLANNLEMQDSFCQMNGQNGTNGIKQAENFRNFNNGNRRINRQNRSNWTNKPTFRANNGTNNTNNSKMENSQIQCTYCQKFRHTIANCFSLEQDLRKKGFKIVKKGINGGNSPGNRGTFRQRNFSRGSRGGRNFNFNRQNREKFNMLEEEEEEYFDENDYDGMSEDDILNCFIAEYQQETGNEVIIEELNDSSN